MKSEPYVEAILCLIDFLTECNEGGNTYSPPPEDLCEWARSIVQRAQQEAKL
jgi:hypothetical protein